MLLNPATLPDAVRALCEHMFLQETRSELKHCGRCNLNRPLHEFHRAEDGHQPWCKECKRDYAAAHYQANKTRRRATNRRRHRAFMEWYTGLKAGRPCSDCGDTFHPQAMHWDHLPGSSKSADIAVLARRGSRKRVLDEIAKCELVCANCHAIRSHLRRDDTIRDTRNGSPD